MTATIDRPTLEVAAVERAPLGTGRLTERDAVDIWIARWLRVRRKELCRRYGCDPRRLYEIWAEEKFAGSRAKALEIFQVRFPTMTDRIDAGKHRRISRANDPSQLPLFD